MTNVDTPAPPATPPTKQKKFQLFAPGPNADSILSIPLFGSVILGVTAFLAWLKPSFEAIDIPLQMIWSDLWDFAPEGLWLGWILLLIAGLGFVIAASRITKPWQVFVVGLVAVAVVGMFLRAAIATDSFSLVQPGAFGALGGALLMVVPRGK